MIVRAEPLPSPADWSRATARVGALFGLTPNKYLTGAAVADLAASIRQAASTLGVGVAALRPRIDTVRAQFVGAASTPTVRQRTLAGVAALLESVRDAGRDAVRVIEAVANADLGATDQAAGRVLAGSATLAQALNSFDWSRVQPLLRPQADDERGRSVAAALGRLRAAIEHDEFAEPLAMAVERAEQEAWDLIARPIPTQPPRPPAHPPETPDGEPSPKDGTDGGELALTSDGDLARLHDTLAAALRAGGAVQVRWWRRP
jgi:hypothetical protein